MQRRKYSTELKQYGIRILIVLVVLTGLSVFLLNALRGKSNITGAYPASIKTGSIVCTKEKVSYAYIEAPDSDISVLGNMRIVGTYNESNQINRIALDFETYFEDKDAAVLGEAVMHGEFGKRLTEDDLPYSEMSNKFSIVDKKVTLSLNASVDSITDKSYKYLLLNSNPRKGYSLSQFEMHYKTNGYKCVSTN